jgi:ABC-type uncharacterized transport system auxiliary subunit
MTMSVRGAAFIALGLGGCVAAPPVPDESFYRLQTPEIATGVPVNTVLAVEELRSDGIHGERALLHSTDAGHRVLQQYHYHFWADPPPRLLCDYLVALLRSARVARVVERYDPAEVPDYVIRGKIWRFEQLVDGDAAQVVVKLELQVDRFDGRRPLLLREYEATAAAATPAPTDAALAFEQALGKIASRFVADLREVLRR